MVVNDRVYIKMKGESLQRAKLSRQLMKIKKKQSYQIILGLSLVILFVEIVSLDFDNLRLSARENILGILAPILLIISAGVNLKKLKRESA